MKVHREEDRKEISPNGIKCKWKKNASKIFQNVGEGNSGITVKQGHWRK